MKKLKFTFAFLLLSSVLLAQDAIHVEKKGTGSPILYLPGFTTPGSVWNETVNNVNGQHENHLVSYAGFNGLEPIAMPWYPTIKEKLVEYIKNEKLTNLTIIGHSMGGFLAIELAAALPDNISKLVLIESIPCMREIMMPGVPASNIQYESPFNKQMLDMSDEAFFGMVANQSQYMTNNKSKIEILTQWAVAADRQTYVYGYTDLLKLDLRDQLPLIHAKTMILGAPFPNAELVQSNYTKQYEKLEAKEIYIASESKHFIMFDQPEWLYEKINTFLKNEL
ncbi:MAG TPA: alpha/beta hydrolase [Fulvivirga sp.]|nr:alpha/beta hydrolase [Fulvivirga sp.]